jgi:methionine aminopeptidase
VVFPDSNNCVVYDEEVAISCPGEKVLQDGDCVSMNTSQVIFGASVSSAAARS